MMDAKKKAALEAAGWKSGTAEEFFNENFQAEHEASDPITRAKEFAAAVYEKYDGVYAESDEQTVQIMAEEYIRFAQSENAQLLAETLRLRQEVERLKTALESAYRKLGKETTRLA